jgi:peptidoglycan-associated lipoprotein
MRQSRRILRLTALSATAIVATSTLGACATKGFVRKGLDEQRAALQEEMRAGLSAERTERVAADNALRADLVALRGELKALRDEFGARISVIEGQLRFAMPVHFGFDDAAVRPQDHAALERFAGVVQQYYRGSAITIEGFADPAGSVAYNLQLSRERAESVRDFLAARGVDAAQLKTVGYGKARQVKPGAQRDDPGAELNRRVVFVIESPSDATIVALSAMR